MYSERVVFIKTRNHVIWLGLGGNVGEVAARLASVTKEIAAMSRRPLALSPVYRSEPWGGIVQPAFLNQVIEMEIDIPPLACLHSMQRLEKKYGRDRRKEMRWGPRAMDIDLLSWSGPQIHCGELTMPHLHLSERRFVLQPFADIAPDHVPAGYSQSIRELLELCTDEKLVVYQS